MTYDISFLWLWLVLAALVGAAVAWRSHDSGPQGPMLEGWARRAAIIWVIAAVVVVIHLFSGRLAFWLESAVLFFAFFVAGALIGGAARGLRIDA